MKTFHLQHGAMPGPFLTEAVPAREDWRPQPARGTRIATRFKVKYAGRWHRVYSDRNRSTCWPHFILSGGFDITVTGVSP